MALSGRDIAILTARFGCARFGASRFGFCPIDVEGADNDEPGEYIWKEDKPATTTWTLDTNSCRYCPPATVASFTADVYEGTDPLTVNFTDTSTGYPTSWLWTFGDGTTSTAQNPSHVFTPNGTYTVTLYAFGPGGGDTSDPSDITVWAAP